ncbi:MAG: MarR family transcriptional regulator [Proteobacteria bacterium]|nr:MarR family transcriptional regulator [Pseudomonadota bacterium]
MSQAQRATPHDAEQGGDDQRLDRTLTYRLHALHKITDQLSQPAYLRDAGLSLSDGRCLAAVGSFAPLSVNDLAQRANLTKGQASRATQALVDQGLVDKADHPEDRRGVVLTLTPQGREVWERTMALIERRNHDIFGCLNAQERATLGALFDRLIAHNRDSR